MNCELQYPFRPGWRWKCFAHCFWWHPRVLLTVSNSEQHVSIFGQKFPHFKYLCKGFAHCSWWHPRVLLTVSNSEQHISIFGQKFPHFKYLCKGFAHCFWWHPRILLTVSNSEQYISLYGKCSNNFKNISSDGLIFFLFNSIFCVFVAIYT